MHANWVIWVNVINRPLQCLLRRVTLHDASLRKGSIPYVRLENTHISLIWKHVMQEHRARIVYVLHKVSSEMYHDIKKMMVGNTPQEYIESQSVFFLAPLGFWMEHLLFNCIKEKAKAQDSLANLYWEDIPNSYRKQ